MPLCRYAAIPRGVIVSAGYDFVTCLKGEAHVHQEQGKHRRQQHAKALHFDSMSQPILRHAEKEKNGRLCWKK